MVLSTGVATNTEIGTSDDGRRKLKKALFVERRPQQDS